jgi:hypothetical protein
MKTAVKVPCRPSSDEERQIIEQLKHVTMMPGTADKRFARQMAAALDVSIGNSEPLEITDGQGVYLKKLVHRYRRQVYPKKWGSNGKERPALD